MLQLTSIKILYCGIFGDSNMFQLTEMKIYCGVFGDSNMFQLTAIKTL